MIEQLLPNEIEAKSFEIISNELEELGIELEEEHALIIKRAIHTSADFGYAKDLKFSKNVVSQVKEVLESGCTIITDTNMAKAGINKNACKKLNIKVECFIADEDVASLAKEEKTTRAAVSMEKASRLEGKLIFAIGNAPTALIKLEELIREDKIKPDLIVGVPVGFVNVVESKELIMNLEQTPYIVAKGRKGGSNIAAAIINALLYMVSGGRE